MIKFLSWEVRIWPGFQKLEVFYKTQIESAYKFMTEDARTWYMYCVDDTLDNRLIVKFPWESIYINFEVSQENIKTLERQIGVSLDQQRMPKASVSPNLTSSPNKRKLERKENTDVAAPLAKKPSPLNLSQEFRLRAAPAFVETTQGTHSSSTTVSTDSSTSTLSTVTSASATPTKDINTRAQYYFDLLPSTITDVLCKTCDLKTSMWDILPLTNEIKARDKTGKKSICKSGSLKLEDLKNASHITFFVDVEEEGWALAIPVQAKFKMRAANSVQRPKVCSLLLLLFL